MKVGLYVFGSYHSIDKYYQISTLLRNFHKKGHEVVIVYDRTGSTWKIKDDPNNIFCDYEWIDISTNNVNSLGLNFLIVIDPYSQPITSYRFFSVPIVYKEYGTAGLEVGSGYLVQKKIYKYCSLIITENDFIKNKILESYPNKEVIVGSPAFDYIFDEVKEDNRFDKKYTHILWTPHHSIKSNDIIGSNYSTFLEYRDYLIKEFLDNNPNYAIHFKPHPLLKGKCNFFCRNSELTSYSRWLSNIESDRFFDHSGEDYHNLFMLSDFIINDSISFLQEWLPTRKRMIVLRNESKFSEFGEFIINNFYDSCYNYRCLEAIINSEDRKLSNRNEYVDSLFLKENKPNSESLIEILEEKYKD